MTARTEPERTVQPQKDEPQADQQDFERIWNDPPGLLGKQAADHAQLGV